MDDAHEWVSNHKSDEKRKGRTNFGVQQYRIEIITLVSLIFDCNGLVTL